MSEQAFTRDRNLVDRWKLPLHEGPRPFEDLSEMVREAHAETETQMRRTGYLAHADYQIAEEDGREYLVVTLVYPSDESL